MDTRQKTSAPPVPARRTKVRREEEETKEVDIDAPELDEFLDDEEGNPGDRRRDPLRKP